MIKYEEQIKRMEQHLNLHPDDYQTVISLLKLRSTQIATRREQHWHAMRQRIEDFKRIVQEVR